MKTVEQHVRDSRRGEVSRVPERKRRVTLGKVVGAVKSLPGALLDIKTLFFSNPQVATEEPITQPTGEAFSPRGVDMNTREGRRVAARLREIEIEKRGQQRGRTLEPGSGQVVLNALKEERASQGRETRTVKPDDAPPFMTDPKNIARRERHRLLEEIAVEGMHREAQIAREEDQLSRETEDMFYKNVRPVDDGNSDVFS